jgi:hypothetical protein
MHLTGGHGSFYFGSEDFILADSCLRNNTGIRCESESDRQISRIHGQAYFDFERFAVRADL